MARNDINGDNYPWYACRVQHEWGELLIYTGDFGWYLEDQCSVCKVKRTRVRSYAGRRITSWYEGYPDNYKDVPPGTTRADCLAAVLRRGRHKRIAKSLQDVLAERSSALRQVLAEAARR